MQRENWFFTPVWFEYLNIDTKRIARKCLEMRANDYPNRKLSNVGGWQSEDICLNDFDEFKILDHILNEKIDELKNSINPNYTFTLDNVWININEKGDYNDRHVHPVTAFSGTVYIQTDENTGKLRFVNEFHPIKHYPVRLNDSDLFHQNVTYTPKDGMIVIFPAWLPHEVLPSESDNSRISFAFNIKQKY